MTTPTTPDRLREILNFHTTIDGFQMRMMMPVRVEVFLADLRALIQDERRDAARKERERCAEIFREYCPDLSEAGALKLLTDGLPDEETP